MLQYWFAWDDVEIVGDAVALMGDDVAVPDVFILLLGLVIVVIVS